MAFTRHVMYMNEVTRNPYTYIHMYAGYLNAWLHTILENGMYPRCRHSLSFTAILIIFEGQFQAFQRFPSTKLVLKTVESRFAALNYYENGSTWTKRQRHVILIRTYIHTYIHTWLHTYVHTSMHTIPKCVLENTVLYMGTNMYIHTWVYVHVYMKCDSIYMDA